MSTVVLGERPAELEALLARRRALGLDGHDEVWEGVYHVAPHAHSDHGIVEAELGAALGARAKARGLRPSGAFNLGTPEDYRVPDLGFHEGRPGSTYVGTVAVVVEVLSPDDETWAKFGFYAARGVRELLVADPAERTVRCWRLVEGAYEPADASELLAVDMVELTAEIDWP